MSTSNNMPDTDYINAIICQADNTFMCPRCHEYTDKLKSNVKRHLLRKKPCKAIATSSNSNMITLIDNSVIHNANTTNVTNNVNITISPIPLQPYNRTKLDSWEELFNAGSMKAITQALECDLTDPSKALVACLEFQHLNPSAPERQSVVIKDGLLKLYEQPIGSPCFWREVVTDYSADLWSLLCRRCADFQLVELSLQAKRKQHLYTELMEGLDVIESYANDPQKMPQPDMSELFHQAEDAIRQFHATPT